MFLVLGGGTVVLVLAGVLALAPVLDLRPAPPPPGAQAVVISMAGFTPNRFSVLAGRPIVPELLQGNVKPSLIAYETLRVLNDDALRRRMAADYAAIRAGLAPPAADGATAPARAARLIAEALA